MTFRPLIFVGEDIYDINISILLETYDSRVDQFSIIYWLSDRLDALIVIEACRSSIFKFCHLFSSNRDRFLRIDLVCCMKTSKVDLVGGCL